MPTLSEQAIKAALSYDWENAIKLNEQIIKEDKDDIDALNRLAYAYIQTGKIEKAKKIYRKTLLIDRYNYIAQKNLHRLNSFPKKCNILNNNKNNQQLTPDLFIEEPGRTKTVSLVNLAPTNIISKLRIGQYVQLKAKKYSVDVRDENNTYLGAIPDDISFRLIKLLPAGNTYSLYVRNVQKNCLSVFIREIKRGKKYASQPSFLTNICEKHNLSLKERKKSDLDEETETGTENHQEDLEE